MRYRTEPTGRRPWRPGLVTALACLALLGSARAVPGDDLPPRYHFEVGQELVYRLTSRVDPQADIGKQKPAAPDPLDRMEWRVFVARRQDDGSWHLLVRTKIEFLNAQGRVRAKRNSLGYCDLRPDGSYTLDEETAIVKRLCPHELFCRLPDDLAAMKHGWEYEPPVEGRRYEFLPLSAAGESLPLRCVVRAPYGEMHGWTTTKQYDFNPRRGLVERIVVDFARGPQGLVTDRRTFELVSVRQREAAWLAQMNAEAADYLDAYRHWARRVADAGWTRTPPDCQAALQSAREHLAAARQRSRLAMLHELYDAHLAEHDEHTRWALAHAADRAKFFAAAADFSSEWQVPLLDGGSFRLAEQRGRVVVLDFWGTNCEYCTLTAPQLAELAVAYRDKDVVFLGMFDRREGAEHEDEKARRLVDKLYRDIPQADARSVVDEYRLREFGFGYPAVVVLDGTGKVHEVQLGYTPHLVDQMRTVLDGLLSKAAD